ncbi:MAG: aminoacetone oxidase family FAD-binding enzyme [Clostridia bacterium]|nr:aminoacetone oxidase family FAD-binding enzyme [Lachnospiraceae bacterium]NCC00665.1 aminoacetone oxidase family FAD-binding enzyme [Clostridia bacterium]NCD02677.1 aminoacetone oxidase family FAD-binding enzyme [Clostridia bacterium]
MKADIIVIGGGASGMAAAICAARQGADVLILERMPRIGKKLLATGNGRCNYTNEAMGVQYYHSETRQFVAEVLEEFNAEDTLAFFADLGILPKSNQGYVYPNSMQAASVVDSLRFELERLGVKVMVDIDVSRIHPKGKGFQLESKSETFSCRRVILACGGRASEKLGSNGSGYQLAKGLGHRIVPVVPALTGLKAKEAVYKSLAGVRVEAEIVLHIDGEERDRHRGEVQLADYGISGIPVFQVSGRAAYGLNNRQRVECFLDFFPDTTYDALVRFLEKRKEHFKSSSLEVFETGLLNRKLIQVCMKLAGSEKGRLPNIKKLASVMKKFPASIVGSRGFDFAQVCAGGVDLKEVSSKNCESKHQPGVYIVGELLDADGICGGYNLQWAWATGCLAGTSAGKECHDSHRTN